MIDALVADILGACDHDMKGEMAAKARAITTMAFFMPKETQWACQARNGPFPPFSGQSQPEIADFATIRAANSCKCSNGRAGRI
jgi:hypothetical protein